MRLPLSFVSPRRSIRRATLAPGVLTCGNPLAGGHPFLWFEANRNRRTAHGREHSSTTATTALKKAIKFPRFTATHSCVPQTRIIVTSDPTLQARTLALFPPAV